MGFLRLLHGRQIGVKDAIFSYGRAMSFIGHSSPSFLRRLELFSSCSSHSLHTGVTTDASVSIGTNMCKLKSYHSLYPHGSVSLCFLRSIHGLSKSEVYVEGVDEYSSSGVRVMSNDVERVFGKSQIHVEAIDGYSSYDVRDISKDAERICKILACQTGAGISYSLDQSGVKVSPDLVVEVLKKLCNAGVLALSFFRWAEKRDGFKQTTECYYHLIEALGKIKQFRLIWNLVEVMRDSGLLTRETFGLISRRYARAKMVKEAIDTFEKMERYGFVPDQSNFNHLIDTICKSKNVKIAQKFVHDMKKKKRFSPDLKTYTILIEGWGQQLNMSRLIEVYKEMMGEGFRPDQVTYGILINAFCKSSKLEEALDIFCEMEARNIKPSAHIYCNLINGLGADKRLNDALKYFKKFNGTGFAPDLPIYNAVVGAYCWAHRFDAAYEMLDDMKRSGINPNSRTYDVILNHLIKAKKTEEAYRLFQMMDWEEGCKPELNTYTMIVRMFCAEGRLDIALEVWKQMNERGILPCLHMFMVLINRLCYDNRLEEACEYFEELLDRGIRPPGQLYSNVIQALQAGGRKDWVIKLGVKLDKLRNTPLTSLKKGV